MINFEELEKQTLHMSSLSDIAATPAYQEIKQMGMKAVPDLVREISTKPDIVITMLLSDITGENPFPKWVDGDVYAMSMAWVGWYGAKRLEKFGSNEKEETASAILKWVDAWVSNPVGSYSYDALNGLFLMTRDKINGYFLRHGK